MGRKPRVHFAGAIYHVMAGGVAGRDIFMDDADRRTFLKALSRLVSDAGAVLLAYCLMGSRFQMAIQVGDVPLSSIMQRLLAGYCRIFNRRHGREGHLFQARHEAILCLDDLYLASLIRYIRLNPVRAGLVARPQDWPWSDHGGMDDDGGGLEGFDPRSGTSGKPPLMTEKEALPSIAEIGADIALRAGIGTELLRSGSRRRNVLEARCQVTREAVRNGHALYRVGRWLNVVPSTMTRYLEKSYAKNGRPDTSVTGVRKKICKER